MSSTTAENHCPACNCNTDMLTQWEYSGLNDSVFNYVAEFHHCPDCGLVYVNNISDATLATFYESECSYFEKPHFDIQAPEIIRKYETYRDLILDAGLGTMPVADIGCGRGGFLRWLNEHHWQSDCTGVDIDLRSIPSFHLRPERKRAGLTFMEGSAFYLPFADGTQSLLTYFHVLVWPQNGIFRLR